MAVDKQALLLLFSKVGYVPSVTDWENLINLIPDGSSEDVASAVATLLVQNPSFALQLQPKTADDLNNPNSVTLPTTLAVYNSILGIINDYTSKIATVSEQASTAIEDEATPTTVPIDTTNKFVKYSIATAGTYTNFPDASGTAIVVLTAEQAPDGVADLDKGVVELWGKNGVWSKNIIPFPIASVVKKSDLQNNLTGGTAGQSALDAALGNLLTPNGGSTKSTADIDNVLSAIARSSTVTETVANVHAGSYYSTTGVITPSVNWQYSAKFASYDNQIIYLKAVVPFGTATTAAVLGWKADGTTVIILQSINAQTDYQKIIVPAGQGIVLVGFTSRKLTGDVFSFKVPNQQVPNAAVEGIAVQTVDILAALTLVNGFQDTTGKVTAGANWRTTPMIYTSAGRKYQITSTQSVSTAAVIGYTADSTPVLILNYNAGTTTITIPENVVAFTACGRALTSDVFAIIELPFLIGQEVDILKATVKSLENSVPSTSNGDVAFYMPKNLYAQIGKELRINPFGIVAKHPDDRDIDIIWGMQDSNYDFGRLIPAADLQTVSLSVRKNGIITSLGTTTIYAAAAVPKSPSVPMNIIFIGDSTILCQSWANIQGAVCNEFSRRLTGVGTEIAPGATSPAALSLANIKVRGTLGDQPIKHEGRGGWSLHEYVASATSGADTNAFWNPTTSAFDLNYYLNQNNFTSTQVTDGVVADGSNMVIYLDCVWNSVYTHGVTLYKQYLTQILDIIFAQYPACKVKIFGVWGPPADLYKDYTGSRNVSQESIMREAVIAYCQAIDSVIVNYPNCELLPMAPTFFSAGSFPTSNIALFPRSTTTKTFSTDHVHLLASGYAQIADTCFYNFLYNYCQ